MRRIPLKPRYLMIAALLLSTAARADDAPNLVPTRDVDIIYRVTRSGEPTIRQRVRWLAASKLERIDGPGRTVTLADHAKHQVTLLIPARKSFVALDGPPKGPLEPDMGNSATRGPRARVARQSCQEWHWTDGDDVYSLCVTDDGVMLRFSEGQEAKVKAVRVTYRPLQPASFQVPTGYQPTLAPDGETP